MSTSYPYLQIARKYGVQYRWALELAHCLEIKHGFLRAQMPLLPPEFPNPIGFYDDVEDAVIAEHNRRSDAIRKVPADAT
jgi:hypothetical protein